MTGETRQRSASKELLQAMSRHSALPAWDLALPVQTPRSLSPFYPQGWKARHWGAFVGVKDE